jgi:hypothetical protein
MAIQATREAHHPGLPLPGGQAADEKAALRVVGQPAVDVGVVEAQVVLPHPAQVLRRDVELLRDLVVRGGGGQQPGVGAGNSVDGEFVGGAGHVQPPIGGVQVAGGGDDVELARCAARAAPPPGRRGWRGGR